MERLKLWLPALLWLPAGIIAEEVLRTGSMEGANTLLAVLELLPAAPCGIPLALACRRLARSGYPGPSLVAWLLLGAASVAGFLGPLPVGVQALLVSFPVWMAVWRLERRPRGPGFAPSSRRPGRGRSQGPYRPWS